MPEFNHYNPGVSKAPLVLHLVSYLRTSADSEISAAGAPKTIGNFASVVSIDIFSDIIHYKCVLVSGGPPICHCLVSFVLHSINIQYITISHPSDISSR